MSQEPISSQKTLKIAYLCDHDPRDRNLYSGGNARIYDALVRSGAQVDILDQGWGLAQPVRRLIESLPDRINLRLRWRTHLALAPIIGRYVRKQLIRSDYDVLFCAYSFHSLVGVKAPRGMITAYTSDATPTVYRNSQIGESFGVSLLTKWVSDPLILRAERSAFRAADLLLWPSEWVKSGADKAYGIADGKAHVLPWGAGIETPELTAPAPALSKDGPVNLLLVGRDWYAKGGNTTAAVLHLLRARGVDARLTVIGNTPPAEAGLGEETTIHPSLDKSIPAELATFTDAFRQAHFLVQPSMESYGFAFCEASAYGLPSLCLDAGGIPVRDGINGFALPLHSCEHAFADLVLKYLDAPEAYQQLRTSTRAEFDARLNWDAWANQAVALMHKAIGK